MLEPLDDTFAEHATRLRRIAPIAAMAFALGGARDASAEVIFDNRTGTSSSGGYVVGEYSPGSVYALGGNFTVPVGAPLHLVGGSIGVSFGASSTGLNEMDLEIAEDVGGADPVGAILASATISDLPTVLTFVDFTVSPEALLTPGASYWLLASMPDTAATAYWCPCGRVSRGRRLKWRRFRARESYPAGDVHDQRRSRAVDVVDGHCRLRRLRLGGVTAPERCAPRWAEQRSNNRQGASKRPLAIS
jgi:hypothetical protein